MKRPSAVLLLLLLLCQPGPADSADTFVREENVAVPMRDGVVLRADVWRPRDDGPFPVLLYRTPYDKREAVRDYATFQRAVERGYAVVIQDVRGRYASEGEFVPYQNEGRDGYDTIEWAGRQPWSDGNVGTFGLSYPGAVQWLAAVESPPHLKAMVPAMTYATPHNFFHSGGVFDLSWISWIWNYIAPDVRVKKDLPGPRTEAEAGAAWERERGRMLAHLPLSTLPDLKDVARYYYEWMRHPAEDPWWEWAELGGKYGRVTAAVLNLSGWHDEAYGPDGALSNFLGLAEARRSQKELRTAVVVGPWVHGVGAIAKTKSGAREFGPSAALDYDELVLRWMDRCVRGIRNGVDREKPVRVFVMGDNRWREADTWPLPSQTEKSVYLAAAGRLSPQLPRRSVSFTRFISDPAQPVADPHATQRGANDYRELAGRDDVLTFDFQPLAEDLEVTGPIRAQIYFSCDAPDSDLWVRLLDVAPDGTAFNLMSPGLDVLRASHATGGRLRPGRVYQLDFSGLLTSNAFLKGHRIRAQLSAAFMPHFSRNLHTGKSEKVSQAMRKATLRIYHDRRRPSRLVLPAIPRPEGGVSLLNH